MEPAPPPITIVNPNVPTGTADLLDNGSDRWRPTRRQKLVVVTTAVVVALIAGGVAEIQHVRHERALDAAAIKDVSLGFEINDENFAPDTVRVVNHGNFAVRVLAAGLVGEGYSEQRQDLELVQNTSAPVTLSASKNCRPAMFTEEPQQLHVRVRTSRGDEVSRTLDLPDYLAGLLGHAERERCGYLRPEEALSTELLGATRHGRDVMVEVALSNLAVVPLRVLAFREPPGMTVDAPLPITLPRKAFWTGRSGSTKVTLRLRVTDCAAFARLGSQIESGELGWGHLGLSLSNTYVSGEGTVSLSDFYGEGAPGDPPHVDVPGLLMSTCPARLFPGHLVTVISQ